MYNIKIILKKISLFAMIFFFNFYSNIALMNPKGQIGLQQRSLIIMVLSIMLIVVIPVIFMTFLFSIKYRESNIKSVYNPNWCHSNKLELIIWVVPILIIMFLAHITWKSTHDLEPSKTLNSKENIINIQVIAMDWKWLFIYPQYGIATINEISFPINTPIKFEITSNSVMNSFFIPQLGSQIYAMAGMNSKLNLIANESGKYKGISSNFSGRGFSGMKFIVIVQPNKTMFYNWMKKIKLSKNKLLLFEDYKILSKPSEYNLITYYSKVKNNLYYEIINQFMKSNSIDVK